MNTLQKTAPPPPPVMHVCVRNPSITPKVPGDGTIEIVSGTDAISAWWRHQMETFSALLAFCAGNSPVTGEFPSQRPVKRSFDVSFDLCVLCQNKYVK